MSSEQAGGLTAAVDIYAALRRQPDPAGTASALHPGRFDDSAQWTPDLLPRRPYAAVDLARLDLAGYDDFHAIPTPSLDAAIERIIHVEGPVHFDVLADRLLAAAGAGRLGSRIRARIEERLAAWASGQQGICAQTPWAALPEQSRRPAYRDWRDAPESTRQLDYVSDAELMLAIYRAVLDRECGDRETAMNEGIHAIGFTRLTAGARTRLQAPLQALLDAGMLVESDGVMAVGLLEPRQG